LYSTKENPESVDYGVNLLEKMGVPSKKIVIGAAFYGRMWEDVEDSSNGLYRQGKFKRMISRRNYETTLSSDSGFVSYWDSTANAAYAYNPTQKLFATFENERSVELKAKYVIDKGLGGIMFWQLRDDLYGKGLLDAIDEVKSKYKRDSSK